jgi:hypothetical protein
MKTALYVALLLDLLPIAGCGAARPRPQNPSVFLDSVMATDIQTWPAPDTARGPSAAAIGEVTYDVVEAQPRWEPWPKPAALRRRDDLDAEIATLQPIADGSGPRERVIDARKRIAEDAWDIYLTQAHTEARSSDSMLSYLEQSVRALAFIIRDFPDAASEPDDDTSSSPARSCKRSGSTDPVSGLSRPTARSRRRSARTDMCTRRRKAASCTQSTRRAVPRKRPHCRSPSTVDRT